MQVLRGDLYKVTLKETGREDADWIHVAQDIVQWRIIVDNVMNFCIP
jgi:hypothetical protein